MSEAQEYESYEAAYTKLEKVLESLEATELPLEEALALYEEGATLARFCAAKLDEAELRVRRWLPGDTTEDFVDWQDQPEDER